MTGQEFYNIYRDKFKYRQNYIRASEVRSLCQGNGASADFCKIFKILIRKFLRTEVIPAILLSNKINRKLKFPEIKHARVLDELIFSTYQ